MDETYRKTIIQLSDREYALYRAICGGLDVSRMAVEMRDRRFLVEWLRELRLPPASDFNDCGLTVEIENLILTDYF